MKSLLLVCNLHPNKLGTFENYLVEFARYCQLQRTRLGLVFSGEPIAPIQELLLASQVEWWVIPDWNDESDHHRLGGFLKGYLPILRKGPWQIVVFQFCRELAVVLGSLAARFERVQPECMIWIQHSGIVMAGKLGRYLSRLRLLSIFVDGMIVLDSAAKASVLSRGWPKNRICVIGNGVQMKNEFGSRVQRSQLGLPSDTVLLISVGSLIHRKGFDLLLDSIAPLLIENRNRHLLIVGDGPLRSELGATACCEGIEQQVHFLGLRDDVQALMAESDLFVLASRAEGLSLAVIEALGSGLPVVVTDVGGHREVITEQTGWLIPPLDMVKFRAGVEEVLNDLPKARLRAKLGKELVLKTFSLTTQVESQYNYFQVVYKGRRLRTISQQTLERTSSLERG